VAPRRPRTALPQASAGIGILGLKKHVDPRPGWLVVLADQECLELVLGCERLESGDLWLGFTETEQIAQIDVAPGDSTQCRSPDNLL
jgi:hypothetical protein